MKASSEDKKRGVASRPASSWQAFWRMLAIVVDLFRVFANNKHLDQMEELIVIDKGDGYQTAQTHDAKPVLATSVSGSQAQSSQVVYDRYGQPVAVAEEYGDDNEASLLGAGSF